MYSSKNVSIRSLKIEDSEKYFEWINNKDLVELNSEFKPVSIKEHNKWFESISLKKNIRIFSIIENKKQSLIGSCSLRKIDFDNNCAELQIRIGENKFQNKGFGSEAVALLIAYGFKNLSLKKVYLHVFETNIRAVKAYEKNFFKKEKLLKKSVLINGVYKNVYLMSVLKN